MAQEREPEAGDYMVILPVETAEKYVPLMATVDSGCYGAFDKVDPDGTRTAIMFGFSNPLMVIGVSAMLLLEDVPSFTVRRVGGM